MGSQHRTKGFSLIEAVLVIAIGGVLLSIAAQNLSLNRSKMSARSARDAFGSLHALARARAVEFGTTARVFLSTAGDSAWIEQGGAQVERLDLNLDYHVDVLGPAPVIRICMTPRGYADSRCNSFPKAVTVVFSTPEAEESLQIFPLGQLRW